VRFSTGGFPLLFSESFFEATKRRDSIGFLDKFDINRVAFALYVTFQALGAFGKGSFVDEVYALRADLFTAFLVHLAARAAIVQMVVFAVFGASLHNAFVSFHDWFEEWVESSSYVQGCSDWAYFSAPVPFLP
jgi:hypothetical protein